MDENNLFDLLKYQKDLNPNALAIIDKNKKYTRKELLELIEEIAQKIPSNIQQIGLVLDHSINMIATIFAILKLGKTYIPVEPSFPVERIKFIMNDAGADLIITEEKYKDKLKNLSTLTLKELTNLDNNQVSSEFNPDNNAYILYTSGSTGKPKGVAVMNRNVANYIRAFNNEFNLTSKDIMLQYSVCTFDIFVEEVFVSLLNGAALAIPTKELRNDINKLMEFIESNNITIISGFPYLLQDINRLNEIPSSLRLLISGGDVLRSDYIDNLIDKIDIYNTYGPSETTVCATYYKCNNSEPLINGSYPIGKPILGVNVEILDENLKPVKPGISGEICISGNGVSNGYIGDRKEENKAFTHQDNKIIYRSGDIGYKMEDGNLAFLHRKDSQIMIKGKRVEPLEVENIINTTSEVDKAVVRSHQDNSGLNHLTAYIVFKENKDNLENLVNEISEFLPDYMIPEYFIQMSNLPIKANGKIDNQALPVILGD